jgi:RHS repeat-associated protein
MVLVDEISATNVLWPLTDNQGTIRDIINNAGAVQNHITYNSFGRIISQTNPNVYTRFNYTGREFDGETGLYYYRSRYYDPVVGRFIGEDAIGFNAADVNLYRYVGNSAVNFTDPMGTFVPPPLPVPPQLIPFIVIPGVILYTPPDNNREDEYLKKLNSPTNPIPPNSNRCPPNIKNCPILNDIPMGKKDKWTCEASCNVQQIDRKAFCPDRVTGGGGGSSQREACENAKRAATQSAPRGCYPRHCQCSCTKQ